MKILGVDPGLAHCGWAVAEKVDRKILIHCHGLIKTSPKQPFPERLCAVASELSAVIDRNRPGAMAVEELFFAKNVKTAIAVAQVRGVIVETAARLGLEVREYTPLEVKMAITGFGRAEKVQVQKMLFRLLAPQTLSPQDDVMDAIAIAVCDLNTKRILQAKTC